MTRTRTFLLGIVAAMMFASCSQQEEPLVYLDFLNDADYRLMQVAYYTETKDGEAIAVRFYESPRIFEVNKELSSFTDMRQKLDRSRDSKTPLRIYASDNLVSAIDDAGEQDLEIFAEWHEPVIETRSTLDSVIGSMAELDSIFRYLEMQNCAKGTATIDQCISFQYVIDGCYARAHKMKQILEEEYGYALEKCFSFEDPSGFLAVDAGDCCVYWWYHVAPIVKVNTPKGVKQALLDPSMFERPVTKEKWFKYMENTYCSPDADWGYYQIRPASWYGPGGSTDPYYTSTNWVLDAYSDLETCD
jgi:hypothetical protein